MVSAVTAVVLVVAVENLSAELAVAVVAKQRSAEVSRLLRPVNSLVYYLTMRWAIRLYST